jgi:acetyl-CoA carboxylase biotin carboxyl carrier protein
MAKNKKGSSQTEIIPGRMNLGQMEQLLSFMKEHGLEEFEYSMGDLHIRLKRAAAQTNAGSPMNRPGPEIYVPPAVSVTQPVAQPPVAPPAPVEAPPAEDLHIVKSPIVGTYYSAPSPGSPPFVKLGDPVETGQVLCIFEAMKLMNEVESDASGEVATIFIETGQPVEYGEPLFAIRQAPKK